MELSRLSHALAVAVLTEQMKAGGRIASGDAAFFGNAKSETAITERVRGSCEDLHVLRGKAEPHPQNADAPLDAADECPLENAGEPAGRVLPHFANCSFCWIQESAVPPRPRRSTLRRPCELIVRFVHPGIQSKFAEDAVQNVYGFPTTRWSELAAIRGGRTDQKASALSELATRYRRPVLAFLLMRVRDPAKAEDLLQGFLAHSLEKDFFAKASEQRGRFRNFLLSSLKNYLISEHRREAAAMRAPEGGFVAGVPDQPAAEPVDSVTPESVFEVAWIHDVIIKALERYRDECSDANRGSYYRVLSAYVVEPCLEGTERPSLQSIADERGISRKQAERQLGIAMKDLRRLLLEEVDVYSSGEEDAAMEIRDLLRVLGGSAPQP